MLLCFKAYYGGSVLSTGLKSSWRVKKGASPLGGRPKILVPIRKASSGGQLTQQLEGHLLDLVSLPKDTDPCLHQDAIASEFSGLLRNIRIANTAVGGREVLVSNGQVVDGGSQPVLHGPKIGPHGID